MRKRRILTVVLLLVMCVAMSLPAYAADIANEETRASALKHLNLFQGVSESNYALERRPTRVEAIVMLIRVLGKESEATMGNWSHPFSDIPTWADKYIGYAYEKGLTNGISATEFGTGMANSDMYLTFVLRALDYSDQAGDFAWNEPYVLAKSVGILPDDVDTMNFLRADVVLVSWSALEAAQKDGSQTLAEKLMEANVFTPEEYAEAKQIVGEADTTAPKVPSYEIDKNGIATVKSMAEFKSAMADEAVSGIDVIENFAITEDIIITKELMIIEMEVSNSAILTVNAQVTLGGAIFENSGNIIVKSGGFLGVYMTELINTGTFNVDAGATLEMDRGGQFINDGGILNNTGTVIITGNGGNLYNKTDSTIENNGHIDCTGYYNNQGTYNGTEAEPVGI